MSILKLVQHLGIKAVGFTGSRKVGMRLFNAALARPEPIPVYAEMSAINPLILFENALLTYIEKIVKELARSVTLGAGQFCTNPGMVVMVESEASKSFLAEFANHIKATPPATMLNSACPKTLQKQVLRYRILNNGIFWCHP